MQNIKHKDLVLILHIQQWSPAEAERTMQVSAELRQRKCLGRCFCWWLVL